MLTEALAKMADIKHALPSETILHGEYHLLMPIDQGGFSIIYVAEHTSNGTLFIVKELFNNYYMSRAIPSHSIILQGDSSLSQFKKDKERFLYEWHIMNCFANHPGAVTPIEYFEENNTAYIVMEHLSGGSMKDNIRTHGTYTADFLLPTIDNVISLLAEMHKHGYVHGDISPDNLVMGADGHYKLIDFGAVREIGVVSETQNIIRKDGYTAAEVFKPHSIADSKSDIYSFCAVLYYALTDIVPEDALERIIIDELRPLTEILPKTDLLINQLVMKGLSMDPKDRWACMEEIIEVAEQFKKSEEERRIEAEAKVRSKKNRTRITAFCAVLIVTLLGFIFCMTHKELIKFRGAETQDLVFYYDTEISTVEVKMLQNHIERKMKYISGADYLITRSNGYFKVVTKLDSFNDIDIPLLLNKYFNCSSCDIVVRNGDNSPSTSIDITSNNRIDKIIEQSDGCSLIPSEKFPKEILNNMGEDATLLLRLYSGGNGNHMWDKKNTPIEGTSYDINLEYREEDGSFFVSNKEFNQEIEIPLFIDCITNGPIPITSFNYSRQIIWEPKQETTWGENQTVFSQLSGSIVILNYLDKYKDEEEPNILDTVLYEEEVENNLDIIPLKKRLDSLDIPYACGWDSYNDANTYIAFESDDVWEIEAALLSETLNDDFISIKSSSGATIVRMDNLAELTADSNTIKVHLQDYSKEMISDSIEYYKNTGVESIDLCVSGRPIYQSHILSVSDEGYVIFDNPLICNLYSKSYQNGLNKLINLVNEIKRQDPFISNNCFVGALFLKSDEAYNWKKDVWDMTGCEPTELREEIKSIAIKDNIEANWDPSFPGQIELFCIFDDEKKQKYTHPFAVATEILKQITLTNEVQELNIELIDNDDASTIYEMTVEKSQYPGKIKIYWYYSFGVSNHGEIDLNKLAELTEKKAVEYLATESFYTSNYIYPPINDSLMTADLKEKDFTISVKVAETLPGQGYYISYVLKNMSEKTLYFSDTVSINNVMAGDEENYSYTSYNTGAEALDKLNSDKNSTFSTPIEIPSMDDYSYSIIYEQDDLHFSPSESVKHLIAEFEINDGGKSIYRKIELGDMQSNHDRKLKDLIPSSAVLIGETKDYLLYYLGSTNIYEDIEGFKRSNFITVNKTEQKIILDVEKMEINSSRDDNFNPKRIIALPFSLSFWHLEYQAPQNWYAIDDYTWEEIKALSLQIRSVGYNYNNEVEDLEVKEHTFPFEIHSN